MFTIFSAVQINRLAQRLSEAPLGRSASVAAAAERFERLLVAKIGADRAPKAVKAILTAPASRPPRGGGRRDRRLRAGRPSKAGTARGRAGTDHRTGPVVEPAAEPAPAPSAPRRRRDADIEAKARQGELPPPPDFSASTHARFRVKPAALVELAGKADATGLRAVSINPVSSSPKALARYRDLAMLTIEAREGRA